MIHPQNIQQNYPTAQPNYPVRSYAYPVVTPAALMASGLFGMVIGTSSALAENLHHVQDDKMTLAQAAVDSLAKGAGTGVATAVAVGVARSIGGGAFTTLAVTLATATGVGYVLNAVGKRTTKTISASEKKSVSSKGGKK